MERTRWRKWNSTFYLVVCRVFLVVSRDNTLSSSWLFVELASVIFWPFSLDQSTTPKSVRVSLSATSRESTNSGSVARRDRTQQDREHEFELDSNYCLINSRFVDSIRSSNWSGLVHSFAPRIGDPFDVWDLRNFDFNHTRRPLSSPRIQPKIRSKKQLV